MLTELVAQLLWVAIGEYHAKTNTEFPDYILLSCQRQLRSVWS